MYHRYTTGFKLFLLVSCFMYTFSLEPVPHAEPLLGSSKMNSEEMLAFVSRQVGQKWSTLAGYAGLKEDEIQQIQQSSQNRPHTTMKKIWESILQSYRYFTIGWVYLKHNRRSIVRRERLLLWVKWGIAMLLASLFSNHGWSYKSMAQLKLHIAPAWLGRLKLAHTLVQFITGW